MKKFFHCHNNGVTAIVSEEVKNDYVKDREINSVLNDATHQVRGRDYSKPLNEGLRHMGKPVFTFTHNERSQKSPWFTGDGELMEMLWEYTITNGGQFEEGGFYVPFSNGCEIGLHGDQAMASELTYVTTDTQFRETFDISRSEVAKWYEKREKEINAKIMAHKDGLPLNPNNPCPFKQPFLVINFGREGNKLSDGTEIGSGWHVDVDGQFEKYIEGYTKSINFAPPANNIDRATPLMCELLANLMRAGKEALSITGYVGSAGPSHILRNGVFFERMSL